MTVRSGSAWTFTFGDLCLLVIAIVLLLAWLFGWNVAG